jgi:hypothetical protein
VGIEVANAYKNNPDKCLKILRDIYNYHSIGNHTYSHANDYYLDYYTNNGVQIDNHGARRSIVDDYIKASYEINRFLKIALGSVTNDRFPLSRHQKIPLARFPGRNIWYSTNRKNLGTEGNCIQKVGEFPSDTEKASELYNYGYHVFGWHTEWKMSFDFHNEAVRMKQKKRESGTLDYSNDEEIHPYFDMCSVSNLGKDRLNESWENIEARIFENSYYQKTVVLMHDRAFRKGFAHYDRENDTTNQMDITTESESDKLFSLISALKKRLVSFKTLDDFC